MNENFRKWYLAICKNPESEKMQLRWERIEAYCERNYDEIDSVALVKLFLGYPIASDFMQDFVEHFSKNDFTFSDKKRMEFYVLAGTIIANLLDASNNGILALKILCFAPYRKVVIPEIADIARNNLYNAMLNIRNNTSGMKQIKNASLKKAIDEFVIPENAQQATYNNATAVDLPLLKSSIDEIIANFDSLSANQNQMNEKISIYQEDSNILSWLFGKWSNILNAPLNKVNNSSNKMAIVLAEELASMVNVFPGPYAAKAFLKTMLDYCKTDKINASLVEIIENVDKEVRKAIVEKYEENDTPILLALSMSLEVEEENAWIPVYKPILSISPEDERYSALDWSYFTYLELLLANYK